MTLTDEQFRTALSSMCNCYSAAKCAALGLVELDKEVHKNTIDGMLQAAQIVFGKECTPEVMEHLVTSATE